MNARMKILIVLAVSLMLAAVPAMAETAEAQKYTPEQQRLASLPCIPYETSATPTFQGGKSRSTQPVSLLPASYYDLLEQLNVPSNIFCSYEYNSNVTKIYVGDYSNNCVKEYTVINFGPGNIMTLTSTLPIDYGMAWLIEDLDNDGNMDLVLQRGSGSNGYLDIHSGPNWDLRGSITLTGKKMYFYPKAINLDGDSDLELFLTPCYTFSDNAYAMVVQPKSGIHPYNDSYEVTDEFAAPLGTKGEVAAADYDGDGYVEIIAGNNNGYGLFEYHYPTIGGISQYIPGLHYINLIPGTLNGAWATNVRPGPNKTKYPYVIVGHSSFTNGYIYKMLKATGNNTFTTVQTFSMNTGYAGAYARNFAFNDDSDGMEEFGLNFYPYFSVYEWESSLNMYVNTYSWNQQTVGTFIEFSATDVDNDGTNEWCVSTHQNIIKIYENQ